MRFNFYQCDNGVYTIFDEYHSVFITQAPSFDLASQLCKRLNALSDNEYLSMAPLDFIKLINLHIKG